MRTSAMLMSSPTSMFDPANTAGTSVFDHLARLITNTVGLPAIPGLAGKKLVIAGPLSAIQPSAAEEFESIREVNHAWSHEAEALMQVGRTSPWLLDEKYVIRSLRSAMVVDRGCTSLGDGLRRLVNITELSVTGNGLASLPGGQLPPGLQLLHACANRLSSLDSLADGCPRSLAHLGVGFNAFLELSPVELAPSRWPALMSLDVSHNELDDLVPFAATVGAIPTLEVLVALGNPFALLPWYRSYIVNKITQIGHLDDLKINPEHRGGVPLGQDLTTKTHLTVEIDTIKQLADPLYDPNYVEPLEPVDPKAKKKEKKANANAEDEDAGSQRVYTYQVVLEFPNNIADPDLTHEVGSAVPDLTATGAGTSPGGGVGSGCGGDAAAAGLGGATVTESLGWASTISYRKSVAFELDDLRGLKRACVHGCRVDVYETMAEHVAAEEPPEDASAAGKGGKKDKKKKKKGDAPVELVALPPVVRFVGSAFVDTLPLLENATAIHKELPLRDSKGIVLQGEMPPREPPAEPADPKHPEIEAKKEGPAPVPATPVISLTISIPRLSFGTNTAETA